MPLIKGAIKKLRKDQALTAKNRAARTSLRTTLKKAVEVPNPENVSLAFSALDKAAKVNLIKKGKADRIKSRLSKKITETASAKTSKKPAKASPKKVTKKASSK